MHRRAISCLLCLLCLTPLTGAAQTASLLLDIRPSEPQQSEVGNGAFGPLIPLGASALFTGGEPSSGQELG
jgi:hypothetical protein